MLASGSYKNIEFWNFETLSLIERLKAHDHYINSLAFSKNNEYLASGASDFFVKIWNS